jgi:glucokinase
VNSILHHASKVAACIDIGGSKALIGLVDPDGFVLARNRFLVSPGRSPKDLVTELYERTHALVDKMELRWSQIAGVGYSTAGMLDLESGVVLTSPNQGNWKQVPFAKMLGEIFGLPTWMEMDANAAALGEAWKGAGKGVDHFIFVVIGTGIGAGILVHGVPLYGWQGTAGELGHMVIDPNGPLCNCGQRGCLEAFASGPAIALRARDAFAEGIPSQLRSIQVLSAVEVFEAARRGDALAKDVIAKTVDCLAVGMTNLVHLLNPRVIAFGGGVAVGGSDLLLEPLKESIASRCGSWVNIREMSFLASRLGEDAGLIGAASLVWKGLIRENKHDYHST